MSAQGTFLGLLAFRVFLRAALQEHAMATASLISSSSQKAWCTMHAGEHILLLMSLVMLRCLPHRGCRCHDHQPDRRSCES